VKNSKIAIFDLDYVKLVLKDVFSIKYVVDINITQLRLDKLRARLDKILLLSTTQINKATANEMLFTNKLEDIGNCDIDIITVLPPIEKHKKLDLTPPLKASKSISSILKTVLVFPLTTLPIKLKRLAIIQRLSWQEEDSMTTWKST